MAGGGGVDGPGGPARPGHGSEEPFAEATISYKFSTVDSDDFRSPSEILAADLIEKKWHDAIVHTRFDPKFQGLGSEPRIIALLELAFEELMAEGDRHRARALLNYVAPPTEVVLKLVEPLIVKAIKDQSYDYAAYLVSEFQLSSIKLSDKEFVAELVQVAKHLLAGGKIDALQTLLNSFNISSELTLSPDELNGAALLVLNSRGTNDAERVNRLIYDLGITGDDISQVALNDKSIQPKSGFHLSSEGSLVVSSEMLRAHLSIPTNNTPEEYKRLIGLFRGAAQFIFEDISSRLVSNAEGNESLEETTQQLLAIGPFLSPKQRVATFDLIAGWPINNEADAAAVAKSLSLIFDFDRTKLIDLITIGLKSAKDFGVDSKEVPAQSLLAFSLLREIRSKPGIVRLLNDLDQSVLVCLTNPQLPRNIQVNALMFLRESADPILGDIALSASSYTNRLPNSNTLTDIFISYQAIQQLHPNWLRQSLVDRFGFDIRAGHYTTKDIYQASSGISPELRFLALASVNNRIKYDETPDQYEPVAKKALEFIAGLKRSALTEVTLALSQIHSRLLTAELFHALARSDITSNDTRIVFTACLKGMANLEALVNRNQERIIEAYQKVRVENPDITMFREVISRAAIPAQAVVFGNAAVTPETLLKVDAAWGTLEPVITYARRLKSNGQIDALTYLAEMLPYFEGPSSRWKTRRYDLTNPVVAQQIGHLNSEQREYWQKDCVLDVSAIARRMEAQDKPQAIFAAVDQSIAQGALSSKGGLIYVTPKLGEVFQGYAGKAQGEVRKLLQGHAAEFREDGSVVNALIAAGDISRLEEAVSVLKAPTEANQKRVKSSAEYVARFLEQKESEELLVRIKSNETGDNSGERSLLTAEADAQIRLQINDIRANFEKAKRSDILAKYGLDSDSKHGPADLYRLRKELGVAASLCDLSALNPDLVAKNRVKISGKNQLESINKVIADLRVSFKDCKEIEPFLAKVEGCFKGGEIEHSNSRLIAIVTDHPQIMLQIGKYPLGTGSCQNYESDNGYNQALLGYVGDAHIKAMILVDLSKLPLETQQRIEKEGLSGEAILSDPQAVLIAMQSRSIIKLGLGGCLIEPAYSSDNKRNTSMNHLFDICAIQAIQRPMKIDPRRGSYIYYDAVGKPNVKVTIPNSRNPAGQYEDTNGFGIQVGTYSINTISLADARTIPIDMTKLDLIRSAEPELVTI